MIEHIFTGHVLDILKRIPDGFVDMCITSPPYYKQRKYGTEPQDWGDWVGELGQEPNFVMYINHLMMIFTEVKRVLKKEGSCYVNMNDTYNSRKSLMGIPDRFKIAMIDDGWICRNEVIWARPNQMPQPATDKFTQDYEKLYFFTKSKKYYHIQQLEPYDKPLNRRGGDNMTGNESEWDKNLGQHRNIKRNVRPNENGRTKRCVWSINTKPSKKAHFAVFPDELAETPILASCPKGGIVLDTFIGSGVSGVVAKRLGCGFIGIDIDPHCSDLSKEEIYGGEFSINW